eukprot:3673985-Pleurochrysis_carterae.AAC.2
MPSPLAPRPLMPSLFRQARTSRRARRWPLRQSARKCLAARRTLWATRAPRRPKRCCATRFAASSASRRRRSTRSARLTQKRRPTRARSTPPTGRPSLRSGWTLWTPILTATCEHTKRVPAASLSRRRAKHPQLAPMGGRLTKQKGHGETGLSEGCAVCSSSYDVAFTRWQEMSRPACPIGGRGCGKINRSNPNFMTYHRPSAPRAPESGYY